MIVYNITARYNRSVDFYDTDYRLRFKSQYRYEGYITDSGRIWLYNEKNKSIPYFIDGTMKSSFVIVTKQPVNQLYEIY